MVKIFKSDLGRNALFESYDSLLTLLDVEIAELDITTYYGNTHCIIAGNKDNAPLLLFHGAGNNSAASWIPNIGSLSESFYCIAVDIIGGAGKTTCNQNYSQGFSPEKWLNELCDKLDLKKVNIVGHSNGALLAYWFLLHQPDRVRKVVCLDIIGIKEKSNTMVAIFNVFSVLLPEILIPTRKNILKIIKKMINQKSTIPEVYPQVINHLVIIMRNYNNMAMIYHTRENYCINEGNNILNKVLFLFGEIDIFGKNEEIRLLRNGHYKIEIIPDTCHLINYEKPDVINAKIIDFVNK
jgi:pimeloyl-ACP methyl ester carboxylesterase